jgi:hypothetical protein
VKRSVYDTALFTLAAAWNFGAAATLLLRPEFFLARLGIEDPATRLLARSLASSVTAWGIGYALLAFNARRFRDFARLGAFSKTLFAAVYAAAFFAGQISLAAFTPALVEQLFAALFAESLWRTRRRNQETTDEHRSGL